MYAWSNAGGTWQATCPLPSLPESAVAAPRMFDGFGFIGQLFVELDPNFDGTTTIWQHPQQLGSARGIQNGRDNIVGCTVLVGAVVEEETHTRRPCSDSVIGIIEIPLALQSSPSELS